MKIGVISDLHKVCGRRVFDALRGVSLILSLGDIEDENIICDLGALANVISVRGNCDNCFSPTTFPVTRTLDILGKKIFMSHIFSPVHDLRGMDVYLYGHTHIVENRCENGVLYFNPGSPTTPRKGGKSIGILEIFGKEKDVRGHIIEI